MWILKSHFYHQTPIPELFISLSIFVVFIIQVIVLSWKRFGFAMKKIEMVLWEWRSEKQMVVFRCESSVSVGLYSIVFDIWRVLSPTDISFLQLVNSIQQNP